MEMLGVYLFLFSKGKFCYEMFDFSGKTLFFWMKPEKLSPLLYVPTIKSMQNKSPNNMYTV